MDYPLDYAFTLEDMLYFWMYFDLEFILNDGHLYDFQKKKNMRAKLWTVDEYGDEDLYDIYDYNTPEEKNFADVMAIAVRDVNKVYTRLEIVDE